MLFTGLARSVWEKTVPLVMSTALGLRVQFFTIRTSRLVNNIYMSKEKFQLDIIRYCRKTFD